MLYAFEYALLLALLLKILDFEDIIIIWVIFSEDCIIMKTDIFISWLISEKTLLSCLQFGPEDGWLSSFYSCLIKKVIISYETTLRSR